MFTTENHPQRLNIIGESHLSLTNRKRYAEFAVWAWEQNLYKASESDQTKNLNYFTVELELINKELSKNQ